MQKSPELKFTITTPSGAIFNEPVNFILLTTPSGDIGIRPNHENAILSVPRGEITVRSENKEYIFKTNGGMFYIENNTAVLVTSFGADKKQYNQKMQQHLRVMEQRYSEELKSEADLQRVQMALRRSLMPQS